MPMPSPIIMPLFRRLGVHDRVHLGLNRLHLLLHRLHLRGLELRE